MDALSHSKQTCICRRNRQARKRQRTLRHISVTPSRSCWSLPSEIKSSARPPTSSPNRETIPIQAICLPLDWNGLVHEKDFEQLALEGSQGHLLPTKHDAPLRDIHRERPHLHTWASSPLMPNGLATESSAPRPCASTLSASESFTERTRMGVFDVAHTRRQTSHLIAVACSPSPDGHDRWTVRRLSRDRRSIGVCDE